MSQTATNKPKIALAVSTALVSIALSGCATSAAPPAQASAAKAQVALEKGQFSKAVSHAESAVLADPRNAQSRALLGAAYLEAGRFQAAATSFSDAMELGDSDPRTVLSYALAQIALGNSREAVDALDGARNDIDPADLGLALALAGDANEGVAVLSDALRSGQSSAKLRQNLAYAYALQGNWRAARVMVAEDVPADMVSDRIGEWAELAAPEYYQQRVASLLQVSPSHDGGQPAQLALANFPSHGQMVADAAGDIAGPELAASEVPQVAVAQPVEAPAPAPSPKPVATQTVAVAFAQDSTPVAPKPAAAPAQRVATGPVVQQLPSDYKKPAAKPAAPASRLAASSSQRRMAATADSGSNTHLVQLGSFASRASAERAWGIYQTRYPQLSGRDVVITEAVVRGKTYFRVAAAGYGARSATAMCQTVKSGGKGCIAYAASRPLPGAVDRGIRVASR
ncbi:SPOR domain-containing protein [Altererythrobacter sp. Z27]|uniref:SPOR domain-containing protein n=1 Tax=Altererythrobacter sp. Z27 TaxID=3461147 RepID=UPI0040451959